MSKTNAITCVFRRPRFPLMCSIDGWLVAGQSLRTFERRLARFDISGYREVNLVDATGESWILLPDKMLLAPGFLARRWRKVDIIRLFNESRTAKEKGLRYPESLIPSRRLEAIVNDLAALLSRSPGALRAKSEKGNEEEGQIPLTFDPVRSQGPRCK
jgi:hypothetical protein